MLLYQRFVPGLAIASYVVGDERSGGAAVIDPTRDVEAYLQYAEQHDLHIRDVVETHVQADYVSGSSELKARLGTDVEVHCSGEGGPDWTPPYADHVATDGHELSLGSVRLKAAHTPGHTPEHFSWELYDDSRSRDTPWVIFTFTGDFLFVGAVGGPDLLGKDAQRELGHQLYKSVFVRLTTWPDITEIFPGHGAGSLCGKASARAEAQLWGTSVGSTALSSASRRTPGAPAF